MRRLLLRKREAASWGKLTEYDGEVIHDKKEIDRASGLQRNNPGELWTGVRDVVQEGWATHSSILGLPLWLNW